jgi:hypothetical protein
MKAQTDTSSFMPLGLWGIWIDHTHSPFNFISPYTPITLTANQWNSEKNNWAEINGNHMIAWIPDWLEDTVMTITEPLGYKLDISRSIDGQPAKTDTSLREWIQDSSFYYYNNNWSYWTSKADNKINGIKSLFGNRTGFYSYFVAHESDFWSGHDYQTYNDTSWWPGIRYVIDRIKHIDSTDQ